MIADLFGSQRQIILELGLQGAKSVLDVGCGNGEKTFFVSQHVEHVMGIDPDEKMIKAAQTDFGRKNLFFQVGRAESMGFASSSFSAVLFNESLHHVPVDRQAEALCDSCRVLEPKGRLLVTEPIHGRGAYEALAKFYNEEREPRQSAISAIEAASTIGFRLALKKEIHVAYACKGFDDLYQQDIHNKPYVNWDENNKQHIEDILKRCDSTPEGHAIIDYYESVWLLIKRYGSMSQEKVKKLWHHQ